MTTQYTIGDVSKQVGLTTKTIRYYEDIGLFTSSKRRENNYRFYSNADIQILKLIVEVRSLGLPLSEVKTIVRQCMDEGCSHVVSYLKEHIPTYIEKTKKQIEELEDLHKRLKALQNSVDKSLKNQCATCDDPSTCFVIESQTKGGGEYVSMR